MQMPPLPLPGCELRRRTEQANCRQSIHKYLERRRREDRNESWTNTKAKQGRRCRHYGPGGAMVVMVELVRSIIQRQREHHQ
jgi:hypothetical protein